MIEFHQRNNSIKIIEQSESILILKNNKTSGRIFGIFPLVVFGYLLFQLTDFFTRPNLFGTFNFWFPAFGVLFGLILILFTSPTIIFFDKSKKNISILKNSFLYGNIKEYRISDISQIILEEFVGKASLSLFVKEGVIQSQQNTPTHHKNKIYLVSERSAVYGGSMNVHGWGLWPIADKLSRFLNIPLNYNYPGMKNPTAPELKNYPEYTNTRYMK